MTQLQQTFPDDDVELQKKKKRKKIIETADTIALTREYKDMFHIVSHNIFTDK